MSRSLDALVAEARLVRGAAPFWDAIESGRLRLPRCTACRAWAWYPSGAGACCPDAELEWVDIGGTGTVYTATTVHRSFLPDVDLAVPYVALLVDLDDAPGARLAGRWYGDHPPAIGEPVRLVADPDGSAVPVFTGRN